MMDYIDQTSVTCHFIHSNNLSTFLSSVDNNVDGCLIFNIQEGGNAASGPLLPSSCAAADLAGCPQPLSHTVTTKQLSRLISFKRHSGQVNVRAFKTAQMAREMHTGAPPHTQTPFNMSTATLLNSTQKILRQVFALQQKKFPNCCLIYVS